MIVMGPLSDPRCAGLFRMVFAASSLSSLLPVAAAVVVADRGSVCADMPNAAIRSTARAANVAAMMGLVLLCMVERFRPLRVVSL